MTRVSSIWFRTLEKVRTTTAVLLLWGMAINISVAQTPSDTKDQTINQEDKPTVETCRVMVDRIARLDCFDTVFQVALPVSSTSTDSVFPQELPSVLAGPVQKIAQDQENPRLSDQTGWITRIRPWSESVFLSLEDFNTIRQSSLNREPKGASNRHQWTNTNIDVFLSKQESDAAADQPKKNLDDKAILLISCENDITSLYVVLPKPIKDPRTKLTLSANNGTTLTMKWRDVEQGRVISAGRGLESIEYIKSIAFFKRVQLQLNDNDNSRAFIFDIEDLGARLPPLRSACHW